MNNSFAMKQIRYIFKLTLAFISRFKGIILASIGLGFLFFIFLRFVSPLILAKNVQKIGLTGRYLVDKLPQNVVGYVSNGLTEINAEGNAIPALAESWGEADDGKTWTFHLADNKVWQDGKAVTATTINYNFEDVAIERPDEMTLVFKLDSPFAPFPTVVSRAVFKKGLLGTGEWKVTKLSLAGSFVEKLIIQNKNGDKKIVKFYPTEERTKLAFKLGQVDEIWDLIDKEPFGSWTLVNVEEQTNYGRYLAVFFNTQGNTLSDKALRQALSYAIDKDSLGWERALGPLSPLSWAYNPQIKPYDYDPERAKDLIENEVEVRLITTPVLLSTAEKIANFLREVGVTTSVQVTSSLPEDYDAFLAIYDIPVDPDQYALWHSTQTATNISRYTSPRIDKLLEDGRLELNTEKRREIYLDFQRFLLEDAPAAFLYHLASYTISRK